MEDFAVGLMRFTVRCVVLVLGLIFVVSLMVVVAALGTMWLLRALWAKITGRPLTPWTVRVNPSAGWTKASDAANRWQARTASNKTGPKSGRDLADVTDVKVKEP